jgi:hypothetical protein
MLISTLRPRSCPYARRSSVRCTVFRGGAVERGFKARPDGKRGRFPQGCYSTVSIRVPLETCIAGSLDTRILGLPWTRPEAPSTILSTKKDLEVARMILGLSLRWSVSSADLDEAFPGS